ncbi:MAG: hypothetical protein OXF02_06210 [Simkaniaceae bacterium]|nr:hypothetical protein [Simkaniaceae bacterium]
MKNISQKVLNLPPYVSTSWRNVSTLHMKETDGKKILAVLLRSGSVIEVPASDLKEETIRDIFKAHGQFLATSEEGTKTGSDPFKSPGADKGAGKTKESLFSFSTGNSPVDYFEAMLQHNPEQKDAPDLPKELLEKVASVSRIMGTDATAMNMPKPEPHCNCIYCQIARAVHGIDKKEAHPVATEEEEIVSDADLTFREWDIEQKDDRLYEVTNPIDRSEHYRVFLGDPVGCTCGSKDCEHIRAVLNS